MPQFWIASYQRKKYVAICTDWATGLRTLGRSFFLRLNRMKKYNSRFKFDDSEPVLIFSACLYKCHKKAGSHLTSGFRKNLWWQPAVITLHWMRLNNLTLIQESIINHTVTIHAAHPQPPRRRGKRWRSYCDGGGCIRRIYACFIEICLPPLVWHPQRYPVGQ